MNVNPQILNDNEPAQKTVHVIRCDYTKVSERFKNMHEYEHVRDYVSDSGYDGFFLEAVKSLGYNAKLHMVDFDNYKDVITKNIGPADKDDIVLSFTEGNDTDLIGASILTFLEEEGYICNGVNAEAARIANDKGLMKIAFEKHNVPTSPHIHIPEWKDSIEQEIKEKGLKYPLIVKVGDFFGSFGSSKKSVVHNFEEVKEQVQETLPKYGSVILEEFLIGREFACFVYEDENGELQACPPVEEVFPAADPLDQWASFEMKWPHVRSTRELVTDPELIEKIKDGSKLAFKSIGLNGFGRADLRMRNETGEVFVLEINDACELGPKSSAEKMLNQIGKTSTDILALYVKNAKRVTSPKKN